jgi:hypothetical protein
MADNGTDRTRLVLMADNKTTLILKGKIGYEEEITAAQAAQIIAFLNVEEGEGPTLGEAVSAPKESARQANTKLVENARDAIQRSGAKTNPEKIVALAAYVLLDGGETVKADAIKSQFQRAREKPPVKFARDLGVAISSGWVSEGEGGELYLTNRVDGIFREGFVFPKGTSTNRQRSTKKAGSKNVKPETLAEIDEFHGVMPGYQPYAKMKSEKDRLLWIVIYMRDEHGRKTVANKEIAWISDHIGTGIPNANISGAFNSAKASGYATRSTTAGDNSIKVTDSGAEYLATLSDGVGA